MFGPAGKKEQKRKARHGGRVLAPFGVKRRVIPSDTSSAGPTYYFIPTVFVQERIVLTQSRRRPK